MKYKIRKRENVTLYLSSEVVELDEDDFRDLEENPYTGNSEEDFLKYISELNYYDLEDNQHIDYAVIMELQKLGSNSNMKEFSNSAEKESNAWFELGEEDESYRKYGGFNPKVSSNE